MASYFLSTRSRQQRGELHAGAYIARLAHGLGLLTEQVRREVLLPPIPPYLMGQDSMLGMKIIEPFDGQWHWSVVRGVRWERPAEDGPEGGQQEPHGEEHHLPPPPPPPPVHRPVYRTVQIPPSLQDTVDTLRRDVDRLHDLMMWQIEWQITQARAAGLDPPPLPGPRVYTQTPGPPPRAGTHDGEAGTSGTHHEDDDDHDDDEDEQDE